MLLLRVVVVGGGIGGLLAGALLAQEGFRVDVFERLSRVGGRFTDFNLQGFRISTGALHMIPHGPRGPLAKLLKKAGVEVEIVPSRPESLVRNRDGSDSHIRDAIPLLTKIRLSLSLKLSQDNLSVGDWLESSQVQRLADAFCGWSLSLRAWDVPLGEMKAILGNIHRYGGPGIPLGGCRAVTEGLAEAIEREGGNVHTRARVVSIHQEGGRVLGVKVKNREIAADIVISNLGHRQTASLARINNRKYLETIGGVRPACGIKISLAARKPLLGHTGVLLTPYTRRVNGVNEVTNADPHLAPPGWHLVMSHQALRSNDLKKEAALGLQDLRELFQGKEYRVLLVQGFHREWPVNRAASGRDPGNRTPLENLYIVGDGAKGEGGIEVEGIALGVQKVLEEIKSQN